MKRKQVLPEAGQKVLSYTTQDYGRAIAQRHVTISSVAAMGLMLGATSVQAAQINVSAGGPVDNQVNGNCSLVEAVTAANTNAIVDTCISGDDTTNGGDEIILPAGSVFNFPNNAGRFQYFIGPARGAIFNPAPPIMASFALPPINSNVVITGNGSTINGGAPGAPRFALATVAGGSLTVSGSTISGFDGEMGGALDSFFGTLTVTGSTVSGNSGVLGGGIYAMGNTNVINSTVRGNNAYYGGGIYNYNTALVITASTISGNTANGAPTANPKVPGNGGGVMNYGFAANTVITNSTISGNTATYGSAIFEYGGGKVNLVSTTVSNNIHSTPLGTGAGGASYGQAAVNTFGGLTLTNSILANTTSAGAAGPVTDCYVSQGNTPPTIVGANIIQTDSTVVGGIGTGGGNAANCDPGQANAQHVDPLLTPLAINGQFGSTQSHAPGAGSPAIDGIAAGQCNQGFDQNGTARPQDGGSGTALCDIGSVENAAGAPPPPPPAPPPPANTCTDGLDNDEDGNIDAADADDCQGADVTEDTNPRLATTASATGTGTIKIVTNIGAIANVQTMLGTPPTGFIYPDGAFSFQVNGVPAGGVAVVTVTLPTAPTAYFKIANDGVTATQVDNSTPALAAINGNVVTLTLTDGIAPGDNDGLANGVIVDPGAGATQQLASSGGGGGCAISDKPASRLDPIMPALLGLAGFFLFWRRRQN